MAATKLTPAAAHLLSEIAAGRDAIFYLSDRPAGWVHLERQGLAARDPRRECYAVLTDAGRLYLGIGKVEYRPMDPGILRRAEQKITHDRRVRS